MSQAHFSDTAKLDPALAGKLANTGFIFGGIGLVASLVGGFTQGDESRRQFFFSWLAAYMTFVTITAGALFFVVLHHLVRASWSTALRRTAENIAANMPLMAVLFVPVLLGMHDIYHWTHHDVVESDPVLRAKSGYLNPTAFIVRSVIYLGLWIVIARFYRKNSVAQDETGDPAINFKLRWWAPLSTLAFALSISFAAFDWSMSTDPHWFSTIYGVVTFAGGVMAFFATVALASLWYTKNGALTRTLTVDNFHDVGKLMWGFMVFWTYTSFSQYFLIWYGNIPEETVWYTIRQSNGWMGPFLLLIVGHFIAPFWILMSRHMKRSRTMLGLGATWLLAMHYLDHYVMVMPNLHHHFHFHWLDLTCLMAVGGLSLGLWARRSGSANIVPVKDPQLNASMEYENAV
jgi:hypothetical protein